LDCKKRILGGKQTGIQRREGLGAVSNNENSVFLKKKGWLKQTKKKSVKFRWH